MRWLVTFVSLVVFIVSTTVGEPLEDRSVADTLAQIPTCAISCLITAVSNSSCSLDDQGCICRTTSIEDNATPCILQACTFTDALTAKNVSKTACGAPIRDKAAPYNVMAITLGVITNVIVAVRLIYKKFFTGRRELGQDDWVMMLAMIIGIVCTVINVDGLTKHGLGKDVWTLQPNTLIEFGKFFYSMEVLYLAEMSLIKLSLSLFYLHIFPGSAIRRMIWATVIANIACAIIFVLAGIVQCIPIDYFWLRYVDSNSKGHCININTFGWTHAAISIAIDVWMIAIPFSQLGKLNLHWKKKIGVIVMFLTGFFVTIVSILRLKSLIYLARSMNPTWDQWDVAFWSTIEVHTGMICTSLPTMRLILVRLCPRVFSTDSSRNISAGYEPRLTPISQPRDLELSGLGERPHSKATLLDDKQSFTT